MKNTVHHAPGCMVHELCVKIAESPSYRDSVDPHIMFIAASTMYAKCATFEPDDHPQVPSKLDDLDDFDELDEHLDNKVPRLSPREHLVLCIWIELKYCTAADHVSIEVVVDFVGTSSEVPCVIDIDDIIRSFKSTTRSATTLRL